MTLLRHFCLLQAAAIIAFCCHGDGYVLVAVECKDHPIVWLSKLYPPPSVEGRATAATEIGVTLDRCVILGRDQFCIGP